MPATRIYGMAWSKIQPELMPLPLQTKIRGFPANTQHRRYTHVDKWNGNIHVLVLLAVMALPVMTVANIVTALPATVSKVDATLAGGVATCFSVIVDLVDKVEGEVFRLHTSMRVVGRGALDGVGVQLSLGIKDKLVSVVKIELTM